MFDLGYTELLLIGIIALIVVGPKDLPKLMRSAGNMVAKVRGTARHFKAGLDEMVRQAELDEMQKKWEAHNRAVMAGTASSADEGEAAADGVPPSIAAPGTSDQGNPAADVPRPDAGSPPPPQKRDPQ